MQTDAGKKALRSAFIAFHTTGLKFQKSYIRSKLLAYLRSLIPLPMSISHCLSAD